MELVFFQTLAAQSLPIQTWYWQPYGFKESHFEMETWAIAFSSLLGYAVIRHDRSILQKSRNFLSDRITSSMAAGPPLFFSDLRRGWTISHSSPVISTKRLSSNMPLWPVQEPGTKRKTNLDWVCRLKVMSSSQKKVAVYDMTAVSKGFLVDGGWVLRNRLELQTQMARYHSEMLLPCTRQRWDCCKM